MPLFGYFPARWSQGRNKSKTHPYPFSYHSTPTIPPKHNSHIDAIIPLLPAPRAYVALSQKKTQTWLLIRYPTDNGLPRGDSYRPHTEWRVLHNNSRIGHDPDRMLISERPHCINDNKEQRDDGCTAILI